MKNEVDWGKWEALVVVVVFEWIRDNDAKMMGDGDGVVGRPVSFISFFSALGSQSNAML